MSTESGPPRSATPYGIVGRLRNRETGEFLAGFIALRFLHQPKTALGHFELLYAGVGSTISAARGAYWAGRAAEAMKDKIKEQKW